MAPNLLQYPIALFGILRAGLVVVNVNPMYTARELTGYKVPRHLEFRDVLPRSPIGRVLRKELRAPPTAAGARVGAEDEASGPLPRWDRPAGHQA